MHSTQCAPRFLVAQAFRNYCGPLKSYWLSPWCCYHFQFRYFPGLSIAPRPPALLPIVNRSHLDFIPRTERRRNEKGRRPNTPALVLQVGSYLRLLLFSGHAGGNARRNLVEHIQPLLRLLSPWSVGIEVDRMLIRFHRSRLHIRNILIADFLESHR